MQPKSIALYNHKHERLLTLREAEEKGYGSVITLKQRICRNHIKGYKVGTLWLIRQKDVSRRKKKQSSS